MADNELLDLFRCLEQFRKVWAHNHADPTADRMGKKVKAPMAELVAYCFAAVIDEIQTRPSDPEVQAMGVHVLRQIVVTNNTAKKLLELRHGAQVMVKVIEQHPTNEYLLTEALEVIDQLHGLQSLLQVLQNLKQSSCLVRAALWALQKAVHHRWKEVQQLNSEEVVGALLPALAQHPNDVQILQHGLSLTHTFLGLEGNTRSAFSSLNGWDWLLRTLEVHDGEAEVQVHGIKIVSQLCRGGAFGEAHVVAASKAIERALCRFPDHQQIQYWGFWSMQQISGASALASLLRTSSGTTQTNGGSGGASGGRPLAHGSVVQVLRALDGLNWGQTETAGRNDIVNVLTAVIDTTRSNAGDREILFQAACALASATTFASGEVSGARRASCPASDVKAIETAACGAVDALLWLLALRLGDDALSRIVLQGLGEVAAASDDGSVVRQRIMEGLLSTGSDSTALLSRVAAAHVSNEKFQAMAMWVTGVLYGASYIVKEMERHHNSYALVVPAMKTLGLLYSDAMDLEANARGARPGAMRAMLAAMQAFPDNLEIHRTGCWSLSAVVDHGLQEDGVNESLLQACLQPAFTALRLARANIAGSRPEDNDATYSVLAVRREATRLVSTICSVCPGLGACVRENGGDALLVEALQNTAQATMNAGRDERHEDSLCQQFVGLCYVVGAPGILDALQQWGAAKPSVVCAAAGAVVELARRQQCGGSTASAAAASFASSLGSVQALNAAGCGQALVSAAQKYAADEDIARQIQLAVGFVS
eukprot:TRINITY_DN9399_c0_g1_i1.p1 TRINITY_DN9399_c0_g1~~TRINITY_DN9399_c0_g1_i1.p1  ORF type:complete len:767 (-),score=166.93 TRINITY_DN9399_c0_g1_i1:212-2512(-)